MNIYLLLMMVRYLTMTVHLDRERKLIRTGRFMIYDVILENDTMLRVFILKK